MHILADTAEYLSLCLLIPRQSFCWFNLRKQIANFPTKFIRFRLFQKFWEMRRIQFWEAIKQMRTFTDKIDKVNSINFCQYIRRSKTFMRNTKDPLVCILPPFWERMPSGQRILTHIGQDIYSFFSMRSQTKKLLFLNFEIFCFVHMITSNFNFFLF